MTKRNIHCPHCGKQTHDWSGYQEWHRDQNRQPTPLWTCRKCGSTHAGPDPEQANIDRTQHDASIYGQ